MNNFRGVSTDISAKTKPLVTTHLQNLLAVTISTDTVGGIGTDCLSLFILHSKVKFSTQRMPIQAASILCVAIIMRQKHTSVLESLIIHMALCIIKDSTTNKCVSYMCMMYAASSVKDCMSLQYFWFWLIYRFGHPKQYLLLLCERMFAA